MLRRFGFSQMWPYRLIAPGSIFVDDIWLPIHVYSQSADIWTRLTRRERLLFRCRVAAVMIRHSGQAVCWCRCPVGPSRLAGAILNVLQRLPKVPAWPSAYLSSLWKPNPSLHILRARLMSNPLFFFFSLLTISLD